VFTIPNTLLVETLQPFHILSPQHLAPSKEQTGHYKIQNPHHCWCKKTIKISKGNNILIMQSASGFSRYKAFAANMEAEDREMTCFNAHIIPDDESVVPYGNNNDHKVAESVLPPTSIGKQ
jgi:hypothetical protein